MKNKRTNSRWANKELEESLEDLEISKLKLFNIELKWLKYSIKSEQSNSIIKKLYYESFIHGTFTLN